MSQTKKEDNNNSKDDQADNRCFYNSVTGEIMDINDGNEEDMYEVVPDMDQYAQDNINQYTDISDNDKQFFHLWNQFIKSKNTECYNLNDVIMEFLEKNS